MDILEEFAEHLRASDKSEKTIQSYILDLRGFARWYRDTNGEEATPESITPIDVREYRHFLLNVRQAKPSTVNRKLISLRAFLRFCKERGLIEANPAEGIRGVQEVEQPPRWLDRKEQYALLRALQKELQIAELKARGDLWHPALVKARRDAAIIHLMLNAGLRVEEVANLRLGDLELNERKGYVTVKGKRNKVRKVPLNADVRRVLKAWLEAKPRVDHDFLFVGQKLAPLGVRGIQRLVGKYARLAGLEDVTPHTLRHTFGKNLVDAGVSLDRVARLMGHSSLDITAIYTRPGPEDLENAVERIALAGE